MRQSNANLEKVIQTMAENQPSKYDMRGSNIGNFIDTAQAGSQQSNVQYIHMSQDLSQAAQQIQDLLQQLQNQGVTVNRLLAKVRRCPHPPTPSPKLGRRGARFQSPSPTFGRGI
ncbi:MAG: hypothetical protein LH702_26240 [Phormidesmis sp. CAN_BIN44]|nr:hypothetical protein [Phormidesmis sp. CAN_BIN44]